jgi:TonB-dependent SusC/RagA subfamily outer membrane receptor
MKAFSLFVLAIFCAGLCRAQKPLTHSRQSSYYTYLYKIADADLLKRYKNSASVPQDSELTHPVDSFKTGKYWENTLPAGNYYKVHAEKNGLRYDLVENHTAFLNLLANTTDMQFSLTDKQGNIITADEVTVNNKSAKFDTKARFYHASSPGKNGLLIAKYQGVTNFYKLGEGDEQTFWERLTTTVSNWFKKKDENRYRYKPAKPSEYTSFMVMNKPKYKPGDTVKFKAFILQAKNKKPVKQGRLLVRLKYGYNDDDSKIIAYINSYREGGFEYSFKLADSLDLTLDRSYTVTLETPLSATYDFEKHTEKENQDFRTKNLLAQGQFKFEEYELKSTQFSMRTSEEEHSTGQPLAVYLKATDENNLPVPDGRVTLTLTTSRVNSTASAKLFVPDTLWEHKLNLDPVGETKVMIPDSIFPKADISYEIDAGFLNSSNESQSADKRIDYIYERYHIKTVLEKDSLKATAYEWGKAIKLPAYISAINSNDDTLSKVKVTLPATIKINAYAKEYSIEADSAYEDIDLSDLQSELSLSGSRTADSIFVQVNNPRRLPFWYTLYAGKRVITAGRADTLNYSRRYTGNGNLTFVCNYVWAGQSRSETYTPVYRNKLLNINVQQPLSVYPGQQVTTQIEVKDAQGKPVANTDVTAWSVTSKFKNYYTPNIPYMGKIYPYRQFKPTLPVDELNGGMMRLNWERWSKGMGLDSIAYYQFTHPRHIYQIEEPALDSITQIAPFLISAGDVLPVHVLYIDNRPVYFSQSQQLERYSFKVNPGWHSLRFRTQKQTVLIDSVMVEKGRKLIFSLNANPATNRQLHALPMPDTLTNEEAFMLNRHLISVADNFNPRMAQLYQDGNYFLLNPKPGPYYTQHSILTGPLSNNDALFNLYGEKQLSFITEPNYTYLFEPGLLKQTSIKGRYPFNTRLNAGKGTTDYTQYVLTQRGIDQLWQDHLDERSRNEQLFNNNEQANGSKGRLAIKINNKENDKPLIKNVIIYAYNDPDFIRVLRGAETNLGSLSTGRYRLFFLLKNDSYAVEENIDVKSYGENYYAFTLKPKPRDSVSVRIGEIISSRSGQYMGTDKRIDNYALQLKEAFNGKYFDPKVLNGVMIGKIVDSANREIVGVNIKVKGTNYGVVTDVNGNFKIRVPSTGKLMIASVGYETAVVDINSKQFVTIVMKEQVSKLQEIVVIGYGSRKRSDLTGAVFGLSATAGSNSNVMIRGYSSVGAGKEPLYIVDGVPVASIAGISADLIGEINVLKDAAATALYGTRAANGVIVITTKKKATQTGGADSQPQERQTLRNNFADYAYWQPRLTTNAEGKASFTTTFPDDLTNWRTFVVGINGNKQTGMAESQIKAYKALSANLVLPQFAVKGDELSAIGKVMNYNTDAVNLTRSFSYNGKAVKQDVLKITSAKIDTLRVTATGTDSLTFEYTIKRDNGYFDGELRKIPLIEAGVTETKGTFAALEQDTTLTLKFDPALGPITFRAEASLLPVLTEETERLREYQYLCNEQLASKLKGLLMQERIKGYLKEPFQYKKNIDDLIKKLTENAQTSGLWAWWKTGNEELWISLHAIEALLEAKRLGYSVNLDKQKLTNYLVYQLEGYNNTDKIQALQMLKKLGATVDYARYVTFIQKELTARKYLSRYDRYRYLLLQQQLGGTVQLDTLLNSHRSTMFGNLYWGEDNYRFFDNSIQLSLLVYQLFANEGKHPQVLSKIRGYLLEQRKNNQWRNTYESALILETLLPALIEGRKQVKPAALTLTGGSDQKITQFPYSTTFTGNSMGISKTGTLPVYITAYQQFFNHDPQKVSKDFTVNTWFENKGQKITRLKGGEQVQLKAEVTVRADADFVMIEVPIPAGCSYQSKEQSWGNEVHREYFKDKVSVFCRKLSQGKYTYTINLMPRYNGLYTINPAKAEMMYFPVFHGREGMKKVEIK